MTHTINLYQITGPMCFLLKKFTVIHTWFSPKYQSNDNEETGHNETNISAGHSIIDTINF